uniref:Platelet-activating factor acetylhydrolase IB subunit beta n=1 Tax=Daphnia magna TaxID=35525 RepID=A0A0P6F8W7_9CRUS
MDELGMESFLSIQTTLFKLIFLQHQRFVLETKEREPEILFVGDSLISHLIYTDMWETMFAPLHPLNFGIGGDQTQHVLWRLSNGELDNIKPKVVVLLVGTNNHGHTADMIADGIMAVVHLIRDKQPQAHIIVMSLLPRGHLVNPLRQRNAHVNELLAQKLTLMTRVQLVNTAPDFVLPDGTISHLDMYDYLHLTPNGYRKVFEPLHDLLLQLLAESDEADETNNAQSLLHKGP